jgi:hypothetical protein
MRKALALGLVLLSAAVGGRALQAAPKAGKFAPHQEPRGIGNLVARGDRVKLVYDAGAIHLLRLSDGRDKALRLPAAAPSLDAHLEPAGLFVSWNKMYDRRPGRLGVVPLRVVKARL